MRACLHFERDRTQTALPHVTVQVLIPSQTPRNAKERSKTLRIFSRKLEHPKLTLYGASVLLAFNVSLFYSGKRYRGIAAFQATSKNKEKEKREQIPSLFNATWRARCCNASSAFLKQVVRKVKFRRNEQQTRGEFRKYRWRVRARPNLGHLRFCLAVRDVRKKEV